MSDREYRRKRKKEDDEEDSGTNVTYRPRRASYNSMLRNTSRPRGGGGGPRIKGPYVIRHNFRGSEPPLLRYDPRPERPNWSGKVEPWTEPSKYRPDRVVYRPEPDTEEMLKMLEKNPKLSDRLMEKLLERMDKDFEAQTDLIKAKERSDNTNNEGKENIEGTVWSESRPGEISGYIFFDSMQGSRPLTEAIEKEKESVEEVPSEAKETVGESKLSQRIESIYDLPDIEAEPIQDSVELPKETEVTEPAVDIIEQLENQDLSPLEVELFPLEAELYDLEPEQEVEKPEEQGY